MYSSKFNYVLAGISGMAAFMGALSHSVAFLVVNFFFVIFNWYVAEHKRELEKQEITAAYEASKLMVDSNDETPKS